MSILTIICGHYGTGKTNLSINMAVNMSKAGEKVALADLDIVNPYFVSSEYREILEKNGVTVISPQYAGTNAEAPSIPASMQSIFCFDGNAIMDAGGDDAGAKVLGRYSEKIRNNGYRMLYVVNKYRSQTQDAASAVELMHEIEDASKLKVTHIVNNSHLKEQTSKNAIMSSVGFIENICEMTGLPLLFTTVPRWLSDDVKIDYKYPVDVYVKTSWEYI